MKTKRACRTPLVALLPAALLIIGGACADPGDLAPIDEVAGAAPSTPPVIGAGRAHLMPLPGAKRAEEPDSFGWGQQQYNFTWRGGPVISHVKVVAVFWGSAVPNQASLADFYTSIVDSPHLDWLSEYNTSKQTIGRGSFLGSYVDSAAPARSSLADEDIQAEIGRLIDQGKVPAPDADTLYMVHFPAGVSISMQNNYSCQQFCAYHGTFTNQGKYVYYGVMPDFSGGCQSCGGTGDKLKNTTIVTSHELVEAITDPAIGIANEKNDASYLAWYDDQGGEIGDVCQSESGVVAGWTVQGEYSMKEGGCVVARSGGSGDGGGSGGGGSAGGGPAPACSHGVCQTGGPLLASCGPCTARVCAADPSCCSDTWTDACVQKSRYICHKRCW